MKHALEPGMRFGLGTVVRVEKRKGKRGALLRCDCGNEYWTQAFNLYRSPGTVSCGCWRAFKARQARHSILHPHDACVTIVTGSLIEETDE